MPTLDWLGRQDAFTAAARVPYRLLEAVSQHGDARAAAHNLLIQGDNLQALKALLPLHRGQVKCIFIDPPYNTQSAFEHYDDNLEHAQWLTMMLPRLQLLRELLREDGSIWVTIDDHEGHYLKVLMDEVFGRGNFVDSVIWQKADSPRNSARQFSSDHDYMLIYSKAPEWIPTKLARTEEANSIYSNPDDDDRGPWLPGDPYANKPYSKGLYTIAGPTGRTFQPPPGRFWRISEERLRELDADGRVWWGPTGDARPSIKRYLSEVGDLVPRTFWSKDAVGSNRTSKNEMRALFPDAASFTTPKPEALLKRVLDIATNPGDLVLDSFLGSGTTAAVAHKMGRRWIGIEMGEHARTHCLPRLLKVVEGEAGGISRAVGWAGGGGFRFAQLGAPVFDAAGHIHPEMRFDTLAAFVWQQETGHAHTPGDPACGARPGTPLLGIHYGLDSCQRLPDRREGQISPEAPPAAAPAPRAAIYLLFNGILGDKRPAGGNVLTREVLAALLALHAGSAAPQAPLVVYGEACRVGPARLAQAGVTFRHIPHDIRAG
ncbi:MAG TPA: site-specific DNA-methyltransferase [Ottowia sp.]|nr:site-specific DNA-methyltransferase [Ottowia sp.]HNL41571.1 site-specific DNA-methyltransferase [Ottowia sp.]